MILGDAPLAVPPWTVLPFGALLRAIALLPLLARHFWEHNRNKALLALGASLPVLAYLLARNAAPDGAALAALGRELRQYLSFIILLGSPVHGVGPHPADRGHRSAAQHQGGFLAPRRGGSVFMGANTYIGNGPNFMVKAIADQAGYRTPSFFGYMVYSGSILLPVFGIITFLFFRPG